MSGLVPSYSPLTVRSPQNEKTLHAVKEVGVVRADCTQLQFQFDI
jgi:hypothetical protein